MIAFDVVSQAGLTVRLDGLPVIRGSWFQYYAPGWTKGYYSSKWNPQTVTTRPDGTATMTYKSGDGRASGTIEYARKGDVLTARYKMAWAGPEPARIEVTPGMVWAPAFAAGTLAAEGGAPVSLASRTFAKPDERTLARGSVFTLDAPYGRLRVESDREMKVLDGRNGFDQEWAKERPTLWVGTEGLEVTPEKPAEFTVSWTLAPGSVASAAVPAPKATWTGPVTVAAAVPGPQPLVPDPKRLALDYDRVVPIDGLFDFKYGKPRLVSEFTAALNRRFRSVPAVKPSPILDGGLSKMGLKTGGYRIRIQPGRVTVLSELGEGEPTDFGLRMAWRRLADLAFVKNGRLVLPTGTLEDFPSVDWRGVHLFVGPQAPAFQRNLWNRLLLGLGYDKVVLQCERTAWDTLPKLRGPKIMSKAALADLFAWYRSKEVEPIPLIQSLGHAEWLFNGGANLDLAHNRQFPYSLDARKPEARNLVKKLWAEATGLLVPDTMHFGMDETDMRGFPPGSDELATEMWEKMMPVLGGIAKGAGAKPMVWGDMGLHKSEAPDAQNAPDLATAARRRAAIPKGAYVADWHYKDDPRPQTFYPVLQLWKNQGFRPIASAWFRPGNVRGFALAADLERVGVLQTTWAGYESEEASLLNNPDQYAAMVLMGDYSWSGRQTTLDKLPYDPLALLQERLYGAPAPVAARSGRALTWEASEKVVDGGFTFLVHDEPVRLTDRLRGGGASSFDVSVSGGTLRLLVDVATPLDRGTEILSATAGSVVKTFRYGYDARSPEDAGPATRTPRSGGRYVLSMVVPKGAKSVRVSSAGAIGGARIWAASLE